MKNPNSTTSGFYISICLGFICILITLYAIFIRGIYTQLEQIISSILFAVGVALLSVLINGKFTIGEKLISATGGFAIMYFILTTIIKNHDEIIKDTPVKIQLKNENDNSILINEKSVLKIRILKDTKTYDANSDGEVLIDIPSNTDSIEIELFNKNYQFVENKRTSIVAKINKIKVVKLVLEPANSRCCLSGRIVFDNSDSKKYSDVIVKAISNYAKVDSIGNYILEIPIQNRLDSEIKIVAYDKEYLGTSNCSTSSSCDIKLFKR